MSRQETSRFQNFGAFYPFYLSEHANRTSRRLHVIGTGFSLLFLAAALLRRDGWLLLAALLCGYGFAWAGHFFFARNRPATFSHPLWSLAGDVRLFWETVTGRRPW